MARWRRSPRSRFRCRIPARSWSKPDAVRKMAGPGVQRQSRDERMAPDGGLRKLSRRRALSCQRPARGRDCYGCRRTHRAGGPANALRGSPYILDAVVVGDPQARLAGLIVPDREALEHWAAENDLFISDFSALLRGDEARALFSAEIERMTDRMAAETRLAGFHLIDPVAEADGEEITPTSKLRRHVLTARHAGAIDALGLGDPAQPAIWAGRD